MKTRIFGGYFAVLVPVLLAAVWLASGQHASAQTPLNDLVFSVGTTIRDAGSHDWSYVLLGSTQPELLTGKKFAVYGKVGFSTNTASFTLRGTIFQQTDPSAINSLLNQTIALGEDQTSLSNALNVALHKVPGITNLDLAQKILTGFQVAAADRDTAQTLALIGRAHPGLCLCAGQGFSELISTITTYEIRELSPATGAAGAVVGRVTIIPGLPVILPAPGPAFQVVANHPSEDLRIRLRWGTPNELRRLSLLNFGFNLWRIPRASAEAAGYQFVPPTLNQLYTNANFTRANQAAVTMSKEFSSSPGSDAVEDPADLTYFFTDDHGRAWGLPPFSDGEQFYYFVTARDLLGRDGLVSLGTLARACRRLPPAPPTEVRVLNHFAANQQRLLVTWQQNTNATNAVSEYWVYRWPNPAMVLTNDAAPFSNRVGVVAQVAGTNLNSFLDTDSSAPAVASSSNFWYTVRAVSLAACDPLLSPHAGPAWGVLRQRAGPDAATGTVSGSCGTPVVAFQNYNALTNAGGPDPLIWNYRFTCQRRDPGIAWVQFFVTNSPYLSPGVTNVETFGPIYFPPDDNVASVDYSLMVYGGNPQVDVTCVVGTFYGLVSRPAFAQFTLSVASDQRQEAVFLSGQLLETALSSTDPLLLALNGGSTPCWPAINLKPDPSGTVGMSFNLIGIPPGLPLLVQVLEKSGWSDLGVINPDSNHIYWVSYPACIIGPLPAFQGCLIKLPPGNGDCAQHIARAADNGPVAPIHVRFRLTERTKEYRLYRSVDDGPLTLVAQGAAAFDPLNATRQIVRTDDAMPPSAARLCYFVQVLDDQGNGSPMSFLGCKEVKPAKLPRPVLAEPQPAGGTTNPQVALTWFCPTGGVRRFQLKIERVDQPSSGKRSGIVSSKLNVFNQYNPTTRYLGLVSRSRLALLHFDEAQLTPPVGAGFGPGPQFTLTANVIPNVPYHLAVAPMDSQDNVGDASLVWDFTWRPPYVLPTVPWPARPLPPIKSFDEDGAPPSSGPRVAAVLLRDANYRLDPAYPVGIRIGDLSQIAYPSPNVGTTNFACYIAVGRGLSISPWGPDPHSLLFRRRSGDPSRRGDLVLPIVVYRQQVTNAAFPHVSGNLTQVSPLIERLPWTVNILFENTPYVFLMDLLLAVGKESGVPFLYLRDQQPVILGARYQYFVVRLNDKRELAETIPAGVVDIPASLSNP